MKILWLTWKDHKHPTAGGAEVVLHELSKRLIADGHEVTWLTARYPGANQHDIIDGITIVRVGSNRYLHPIQALIYYLRYFRSQFDAVIEVVNTAPYFSVAFGGKAKKYLFYHQLAREIWFYEARQPISFLGYYVFEPLATRLLATTKIPTITVSSSTRADLIRFGFRPRDIHIISEGIEMAPVKDPDKLHKYTRPTVLSIGSMRAMKRTLDQIEAFELAKTSIPELRLVVAGSSSGEYGEKVLAHIAHSPFTTDIEYLGRVSAREKVKLLQKAHIIMQTARKEGWGLTITEAASQGTPAVAYDVDGLRDSIKQDITGIITNQLPEALSAAITKLFKDPKHYTRLRKAAWQWSHEITFDQSYKDFRKVLKTT